MVDRNRQLLLSVKPRYSQLILSGRKTVELRRTRPRVDIPTEALIYASSPTRALVGRCRVETVVALPLQEMWALHGPASAITLEDFDRYFSGASLAYGLFLTDVAALPEHVDLRELRANWAGFQPPQSFRYVPYERGNELLALVRQ
jgi:predicted transcriptional regulator